MNREEAAAVLDAMIFGVYPDDDITINKIGIEAVRFAITALREKQQRQPDPITGLVPCGCGGKANIWPSDLRQAMVTAYQVGCIECAMTTVWARGKQENAVKVWNRAMGYTPPGANGLEPDGTAPNGDKGAEQ